MAASSAMLRGSLAAALATIAAACLTACGTRAETAPDATPAPEAPAVNTAAPGALRGTYQLTYYWVTAEDDFVGPADTQLLDATCGVLDTVPATFAASLATEGTGRLSDGRVVNVLYRRTKQQLIDQVLAGLPGSGTVRHQFHQLWARLRAFERADPVAFTFLELHHHADYLDRKSRALELESLLPIARFLELASREGHVRRMHAPAMMAMVWGAFVGLVKADRIGYVHLTDDLSAQVEATLWDAIRPRTPQEKHA